MVGGSISHYKIIGKIGEGGMGIIYKALDTKLKRDVALKFLPPELACDAEAKERFIKEAQTVSGLDHPNICTIYEIDETKDGQMFIAMVYYKGKTLKDRLKEEKIQLNEALDITISVANGLAKAHKEGIIHRDIKPANIFITEEGVVKILDYGLAKLAGQTTLTRTGTIPGTAAYMSPEQARGIEMDHKTDIWSLGVVLYEMITKQLPFKGDYEQAIIYSICNTRPQKITALTHTVPTGLVSIIDKALQKNPSNRYRHIDQMINDLKGINRAVEYKERNRVFTPLIRSLRRLYIAAGILVFLFACIFLLRLFVFKKDGNFTSKTDGSKEPISLAVISFENQTGNDAYDYLQNAIPNLLITGLEQSPQLQVTSWERLYDLLKQTGKEDVIMIDKEIGFEICFLDGIDAIVLGSFIKTGDLFATDVKVLDAATKRILTSARAQGSGVESILKHQIDQLCHDISKGLIHSQRKIDYQHANIMDVTTSSLEAYRYYLRGMEEYYRGTGDATKYFEKAVEMDTSFATAYLWLGRLFNPNLTMKNIYFIKARQYSQRATKKERLYIEAEVTTDAERRFELFNQIIRLYPKEKYARFRLAEHYAFHEEYETAEKEYLNTLELDPDFVLATNSLCYLYAEVGNHDEAEKYLQRLSSINPGDVLPMITVANIYFVEGKLEEAIRKYNEASEIDPTAMSETYASIAYALLEDFDQAFIHINNYKAIGYPPYRDPGSRGWRCHLFFLTGRYNEAIKDVEFSLNKFEEWQNLYFASLSRVLLGWMHYETGNYKESRKYFTEYRNNLGGEHHLRASEVMPSGYFQGSCLAFYGGENPQQASGIVPFTCDPFLGLVDVRQGYLDSARIRLNKRDRILADAHTTTKEVINVQYKLLEAELLMAEDSLDAAIAIGEEVKELSLPRYFFTPDRVVFYNLPWTRDVLARAYQKKGNTDKAIEEYKRLLHFNPGSKDRRIINPVYHYRLAVLYQAKGQENKAVQHLEQFLDLWKDADKNIPELIDAKKRLE